MADSRQSRFPLGAEVTVRGLSDDPYPLFHALRREEPVTWSGELGMWLLTRRDHVVEVLGDPDRFTTDSTASTIKDIFGPQMLSSDGEAWIRYKRACMGPFRRSELETTLLRGVSAVLDEIFHGLAGTSGADLSRELSGPLSVLSVLRVLGLPSEEAVRIRGWYDHFAAALGNFEGDEGIRAKGHEAAAEFTAFLAPILEKREPVPEGSLIHSLVRDPTLSSPEVVSNLLIVLFGGIETAESMISVGLWSILAHAELHAALVDGTLPLEAAVEEALRWQTPVQSCTRFTTEAVQVGGVQIPKDETVQCMLGAANRDPAYFPDPDRYDPSRANAADHLSFGAGRHFCLGATMARLETHLALSRVFAEYPRIRCLDLTGSRPWGHEFRKPRQLPVVWS